LSNLAQPFAWKEGFPTNAHWYKLFAFMPEQETIKSFTKQISKNA
jgi:hypothetical protein